MTQRKEGNNRNERRKEGLTCAKNVALTTFSATQLTPGIANAYFKSVGLASTSAWIEQSVYTR